MGISPVISKKRIEDAARLSDAAYELLVREAAENNRAYESFHNNLAFFSGGTVALSVTYFGYLRSELNPVSHEWLIIASWVCLLICVASALFQNYFQSHYRHFARQREYNEKMKLKYETHLEELPNIRIANPGEVPVYKVKLNEAIENLGGSAGWSKRREKFYRFVSVGSSLVARLMFLVGLGFLLAFAVRNL